MKKLDLVKLININPYKKNNLKLNMHGIIITVEDNWSQIMFFNPENIGDFAIVKICNSDFTLCDEKLPNEIKKELLKNFDKIIKTSKDKIEIIPIKEYSMVELIVERPKYAKFNIHKGAVGCVVDNKAVNNCIEVDFSSINEKGNFEGLTIGVKIEDLKVIS